MQGQFDVELQSALQRMTELEVQLAQSNATSDQLRADFNKQTDKLKSTESLVTKRSATIKDLQVS